MEFREMRRKNQQLSESDCVDVLERNTCGVLSVLGDGGYPYGVPLSYVYTNDCIYFHCAKSGHKLDAIQNCDKVSFCIVDNDEIAPEKYTTLFRSVIVFGTAKVIENGDEFFRAADALGKKYAPDDSEENRRHVIEKEAGAMLIVRISVDRMSGKEGIELVRAKQQKS